MVDISFDYSKIDIFDLQDYFFRHIFAPETKNKATKQEWLTKKDKG